MANVTTYVPPTKYEPTYVPKFGDIYLEKLKREEDKKQQEIQNAQVEEQLRQRKEEAERNDAVSLQRNTLTMIQGLTDPESVQKVVGSYNKQPLIQKYQLNLPEDGLTMPSKKSSSDPLAKEIAIIKSQEPSLTDAQARIKAGLLALKPESQKESAKRVGVLADEITTLDQSLFENSRILKQVEDLSKQEIETGRFSDIKTAVGGWLSAIGMDDNWVEGTQDLEALKSQLDNAAIKDFKAMLGGQFTEREGQMLKKAYGEITDTKQKLKLVLQNRIGILKNKRDSIELESVFLDQGMSIPEARSAMKDSMELINVPPTAVTNGIVKTFDEYVDFNRTQNPNITYSQVVEGWNAGRNAAMGTNKKISVSEKNKDIINKYYR